jgi:FkbM family methyltransferase
MQSLAAGLPRPIVYVDVGARAGIDNSLVELLRSNGKLKIVGFEPDNEECQRLRSSNPGDVYLPYGLGDAEGTRKFYVTALTGASSFFEPDLDAFRGLRLVDLFRVVRTVELPIRRLDGLIASGEMPQPDFVKIDTQGSELNILKGCGEKLRNLVGVRLEAQLRPLYKGQPTFFDIYHFMSKAGLILRDIRLHYPIGYEFVEFDGFFSLDPRGAGDRSLLLKIWEIVHDIPPGRNVNIRDGRLEWIHLVS